MALVGGGGSPNVAGGNPSGTGSSLNYVGNHAYAYSGSIEATNAVDSTMLDFTTSSSYVKATAQFYYGDNSATSDDMIYTLKINNETIFSYLVNDPVNPPASSHNYINIILPPFSRVQILAKNRSSSTPREVYATISGRVYA